MSLITDSSVRRSVVSRVAPREGVTRPPLMEMPIVAAILALAAGSMDGFTFFSAHTFSTVQSGNVIQVGYWIAKSDLTKVGDVGLAIVAFGAGAMVTAFIQEFRAKRGHAISPLILLTEAAILAIVGLPFVGNNISTLDLAYIVSFVAGMQGNAFHKSEGMLVGNVAVTLNVQLAFNYLARALFGTPTANLRKGGVYALVMLGFAAGGVLGGLAANHTDVRALWVPAAILLALGILTVSELKSNLRVDPQA
ncbi:MAG: YoaK family protein [Solirubrobacteraceae bacterium]